MTLSYALESRSFRACSPQRAELDIDADERSIKPIEFTQYRHPPSSSGASWNRKPRCEPHVEQRISVRSMPCERSSYCSMRSSPSGAENAAHPHSALNLFS